MTIGACQRDATKFGAETTASEAAENVLLAVGLERRLGSRGVHANALHPGGIMTELSRHL